MLMCSAAFALPSWKLIPAGHWLYDSMMTVAAEDGEVCLAQNAPLSVAEIRRYLREIDPEKLSPAGVKEYERIIGYLDSEDRIEMKSGVITLGAELQLNPEFYYKSNDNIDWTFHYYYKDNAGTLPVFFDVADAVLVEADLFAGKNYYASADGSSWTNIPFSHNDFEFSFPRTAYLSTGFTLKGEACINFQIGRTGLSIGNTQTDSIVLSDKFETDGYAQLSFFSPGFRYTGDVAQVDVNQFLYLHRIDLHPFKRIQIGLLEGTFVDAPFEFRFLNPLMIMHSFGAWEGYGSYNETTDDGSSKDYPGGSRACAYFGITFDLAIAKYSRLYGLYAQNEIQTFWETQDTYGRTIPDSFGFQLGEETKLPSKAGGHWIIGIEGVYTNPWLYIKQDPDWSLFHSRYDELTGKYVNTWIGSQFGPDTIAGQFRFGYDMHGRWSVETQYLFMAQGENSSFDLFDDELDPEGRHTYYPSVAWNEGLLSDSAAEALARAVTPTGIPQYTNRVLVRGSYQVLPWMELSSQIAVSFVSNCGHIENNFQCGFEFANAVTMTLR
jgi:hypothetical protein